VNDVYEVLSARMRELGRIRDELCAAGASKEEVEAIQLEVVRLQWELARALTAASSADERAA
jgi:hypothetical protein